MRELRAASYLLHPPFGDRGAAFEPSIPAAGFM
jgi:hypothetical protein